MVKRQRNGSDSTLGCSATNLNGYSNESLNDIPRLSFQDATNCMITALKNAEAKMKLVFESC
jgi:hypothetical protein